MAPLMVISLPFRSLCGSRCKMPPSRFNGFDNPAIPATKQGPGQDILGQVVKLRNRSLVSRSTSGWAVI